MRRMTLWIFHPVTPNNSFTRKLLKVTRSLAVPHDVQIDVVYYKLS